MSKKGNLGRSLIKDKFGKRNKKNSNENFLHTSELKDGYDWNKINLQSVTEQNSFAEFMSTAELAGTEFVAEKLNVAFIDHNVSNGVLSSEERKRATKLHEQNKKLLRIPRRPKWDEKTTAEELQANERQEFLNWRRELNLFQEESNLIITPYEKNLDFWRQLWRVVERSDVVVQIVDARNPLLFRCEDLEIYVKEVDKRKQNVILCNKSDFLTSKQRETWTAYFTSIGVNVAFFSAKMPDESDVHNEKIETNENSTQELSSDSELETNESYTARDLIDGEVDDGYTTEEEEVIPGVQSKFSITINSSKQLAREELISYFENYIKDFPDKEVITIGLVGYPNVGKSSTINSLLTCKKVPVSATPGKTKHFQTLYLDHDIMLCDCPGLVMPSFVLTKADMILNGILPIDQMRDHVPPVSLLCSYIPRHILEAKYGIMIPKPNEGEDPNRPPRSEELLNSYAYNRGFMTANGQPDNARAARYILKDFVNGKLLYSYAPPNVKQSNFHTFPEPVKKSLPTMTPQAMRAIKASNISSHEINQMFFNNDKTSGIHVKQKDKPSQWKNHKEKRNKHVKARVQYRYLDE